jgi:hypothetical protein
VDALLIEPQRHAPRSTAFQESYQLGQCPADATYGRQQHYVDATRKPPAQPTATDAEAVDLFRTMDAYAGTYRVQGDEIIIHVELAWNQVLTETKRFFRLDGDRLTLTTRPLVSAFLNNQTTVTTVVYERVK